MALDTFERIWRQVFARVPIADTFLCQQWVNHTFRDIAEHRQWSWLRSRAQFLFPTLTNAGTVSVVRGSSTVTGIGTTWTGAEVGQQFRLNNIVPIYTITSVDPVGQTLTIDDVFGGMTTTGTYQIYLAYVTVPTNFHSFISIYDVTTNRLILDNITQHDLDKRDAQRTNTGDPFYLVPFDYDTVSSPPLPRYEMWPHVLSQRVVPFLYETRPVDLMDAGATLPRYIRGDILLEGALRKAALWPGPSAELKNPYFNIALAGIHQGAFDKMVVEMAVKDDEVYETDTTYEPWGFTPEGPFGDAKWMQSHIG